MSKASASPSEPPPRLHSAQVGRYQLVYELASGGMASVFLAVASGARGFGKVFALKRMHPHLARDAEFTTMFLDEARVASLLHHANLCSVLDYGEQDGLPYLTMEYLIGESLARVFRARSRGLSPAQLSDLPFFAARIIADACHGLHSAHHLRHPTTGEPLNLVHRDISPQNIFITYDGVARVVDFGIARVANQEHHTQAGTIKGKFAYMAPEHMVSERLDGRADIWGLGVVLWELLAGRRLFRRGSEMETFLAVTQEPLPDVRERAPQVPEELARAVTKALSRDKGARYATASEMARDLEVVLASRSLPFGVTDVAQWMKTLFPDGLARKEALIAEALSTAPGEPIQRVAESSLEMVDLDSRPSGRSAVRETRSAPQEEPSLVYAREDTGVASALAPPPAQSSSSARWFVAGLILALGFAVGGWWWSARNAPAPAAASSTPPVERVSEAPVQTPQPPPEAPIAAPQAARVVPRRAVRARVARAVRLRAGPPAPASAAPARVVPPGPAAVRARASAARSFTTRRSGRTPTALPSTRRAAACCRWVTRITGTASNTTARSRSCRTRRRTATRPSTR